MRGALAHTGGKFVGIELDEAVGKNNGTVKDKQYFVCPPQHGVICRFISYASIQKKHSTFKPCTVLDREYDVDFVYDDDDDDDAPTMQDVEAEVVDLARAEKERQLGNALFGKHDWLGAIAK